MAEPYRFGGPIPEAVRRMQARRFAAAARARAKPVGVDALGMPIFPRAVGPVAQALALRAG